jgi:branched-chain amino acid transport system substrate-binding protein
MGPCHPEIRTGTMKFRQEIKFRQRALAAVAIAAVGCSSSASSNSISAGSNRSSASSGGPAIVIGSIGSYTGTAGDGAINGQVIQAWASWINSQGGLNGHRVRVIDMDDTGSPSLALQEAKQLVTDQVVALVAEASDQSAAWTSVMDIAGIPIVGGEGTNTYNYTDHNAFPVGAGLPVQLAGQFAYMKSANLRKLGILYCTESAVCGQLVPAATAVRSVVGGPSVAYSGQVAPTSPSYTPQCLALKDAGADAVTVAAGPQLPPRVMSSCASVGVAPVQVNFAASASAAWLSSPSLTSKTVLVSPISNYLDKSLPATAEFYKVIDHYVPEIESNPFVRVSGSQYLGRAQAVRNSRKGRQYQPGLDASGREERPLQPEEGNAGRSYGAANLQPR